MSCLQVQEVWAAKCNLFQAEAEFGEYNYGSRARKALRLLPCREASGQGLDYKRPVYVPETGMHRSVGPSAFPPGRSKNLPGIDSSSPGPQLQCAGTTTGSLLISLVTIAIDLQNTVLCMPFCKEGPAAAGTSRGFPGCIMLL